MCQIHSEKNFRHQNHFESWEKLCLQSCLFFYDRIRFETIQAVHNRWRQSCKDDLRLSRLKCVFLHKKLKWSSCLWEPLLLMDRVSKASTRCFLVGLLCRQGQVIRGLLHPKHKRSLLWLKPWNVNPHKPTKLWKFHSDFQSFLELA
jgi:hypothetical protein